MQTGSNSQRKGGNKSEAAEEMVGHRRFYCACRNRNERFYRPMQS
jgi:hypothetical protein